MFFFHPTQKKKKTFSWVQIAQGGAGGVQRILYRLEFPPRSVCLIQLDINLLSLKTRLQHRGKKNATLGFFFFFLVFVVAESAKPCRCWTVAQLPSSSCAFRDRKQRKRQEKRLQRRHFLICQQIRPPAPNGREREFLCFLEIGG